MHASMIDTKYDFSNSVIRASNWYFTPCHVSCNWKTLFCAVSRIFFKPLSWRYHMPCEAGVRIRLCCNFNSWMSYKKWCFEIRWITHVLGWFLVLICVSVNYHFHQSVVRTCQKWTELTNTAISAVIIFGRFRNQNEWMNEFQSNTQIVLCMCACSPPSIRFFFIPWLAFRLCFVPALINLLKSAFAYLIRFVPSVAA